LSLRFASSVELAKALPVWHGLKLRVELFRCNSCLEVIEYSTASVAPNKSSSAVHATEATFTAQPYVLDSKDCAPCRGLARTIRRASLGVRHMQLGKHDTGSGWLLQKRK
jgi:hypothetical protein